jgi:hypothetical protein
MSKWKTRIQFRCFARPVIFSVNDITFAMSGHNEAHFIQFVARHLDEIASSKGSPFGNKSATWVSAGYMQIRGLGVYR